MRSGVGVLLVAALGCRGDPPSAPRAPLVVNELSSSNVAGRVDPASGECPEHDDWIELLATGSAPVRLSEYTLADGDPDAVPARLPDVELAPGERLVLTADGDAELGDDHLPFSLSRDGEVLVLRRGGEEVWRLEVPPLDPDVSYGRYGDGAATWRTMVPSPGEANEAPPADPCLQPRGGFDDHSVPCLASVAGFESLATGRQDLRVVKFDVTGFPDRTALDVRFLDSRFYALHDEWYFFRMLNGQPFEGEELYPPYEGSFETIADIYDWATLVPPETLFPSEFLRWTDTGRLTSQRYYELALDTPRRVAAATLIHAPAVDGRPERWAFELEHGDDAPYEDVAAIFDTVLPALAPEIGGDLRWLVRSPEQELVARRMEDEQLRWHDRLLRYAELSVPGEVQVYRPGLVAGRVRVVRAGEPGLEDARSTDVLVLDEIPDWLPPCAALITTVPQTPLAHVALLAESRGIPNLYVAGLSDDPEWSSWGRIQAPVALRATTPGDFEFEELTSDEWATWTSLQTVPVPELGSVDPDSVPWTTDLASVPIEDMPDLRLSLGGKSAGFVALLDTPGVVTPDTPLAVSIRAYAHHVAPLLPTLETVLAAPEFGRPGDERSRLLVLEGREAYDERYPAEADGRAADLFLQVHPDGDPLGDLARADGVRGAVASAPLPTEVREALLPVIDAQFAALSPLQGLRFRSSSNVEDAEGFVGAGLYDSNTGYRDPAGGDPVDVALRETWASYWGAEAFEERHAVGLDHLAGAMGVTVHPHFQDEDEVSNGVIHATLLPDGGFEMTVNAQIGAISVTNPPVDACTVVLPEVAVVREDADGGREILRLQRSSESPDAEVLSDAKLLALADQVRPVAEAWKAVENERLPANQVRSTLTLDLEVREVADGWPDYVDGHTLGQRLVLKQCRSLEPSAAGLPEEVQALPFPRDLLARARLVQRWTCTAGDEVLVVDEATTDPLATPDLGYAERPFVARLEVAGEVLDWTELAAVDRPGDDPFVLAATTTAEGAARTGVGAVDVDGEALVIDGRSTPLDGCVGSTTWASPDDWLDGVLAEEDR